MADITISLSDDRKLSIKDIGVSQFLTIWDDLLASKVVRGLVDEKQVTLSCDEEMMPEVLETFKKNRELKLEADNEEISGKKLKGLVQEGLFAAGIVIEQNVEDGDLTSEINKMFDVDSSLAATDVFNAVADMSMKGVNQLDATAAAYFAAKIAAMFVWEQMKDNYIVGLKNSDNEHERQCGKALKKLLGIDIDEVLQNRINIEYPPGPFPKGNRYLKKWFGVDGESSKETERDYAKATEIIDENEFYDINECVYIAVFACMEYMFLRCRPFLGKELAERDYIEIR